MASIKPTFDAPSFAAADIPGTVRRLVDIVTNMLRGNLNATLDVTLTASATTTTVKDPRIGPYSAIGWTPLSASASTAEKAGIWVSTLLNGQMTLNHASNAATDQNLRLTIIG